MDNPFFRDYEDYDRDLDVVGGYIENTAHYLARRSGRPYDEMVEFVKSEIQSDDFQGNDPETLTLQRKKNGDREITHPTFTQYIRHVAEHDLIMSPTMAVYLNAEQKESVLADYLIGKGNARKKAKKEMFLAGQRGDHKEEQNKKVEQTSLKTSYNSLSGAHNSTSTPLYNKTTHSSLTSTCRSATSYANANNEKFLAGNRHYFNETIVVENMVSISCQADLDAIEKVMDEYSLVYPSVEDVIACVRRSSDLYWSKRDPMVQVCEYAACMSPVERAAFLYVSDMYHLAQLNPDLVKTFLLSLVECHTSDSISLEDATVEVGGCEEAVLFLAALINGETMKGLSLSLVTNPEDEGYRPDVVRMLGATIRNIHNVVVKHNSLIKAFWVTDCMPPQIHSLPSIVRRTAVLSDTDSTIFTVQYWVKFVFGDLEINDQSLRLAYGVVYLCSQLVIHLLAMMSKSMGVEKKYMRRLEMKNEFFYPALGLTSRSKHYFAFISAQEGNVKSDYELEMKGVGLRDSNCPPYLMEQFIQFIRRILESIISTGKFSLTDELTYIGNLELEVKKAMERGDTRYLKTAKIKQPNTYNSDNPPPLRHYRFYRKVLEPIYGPPPELPYDTVKVPVDLESPTKFKAWLASIEDPTTRKNAEEWAIAEKAKGMTMSNFQLPIEVVVSTGIPKEILPVAKIRQTIKESMGPFYIALESFGVFLGDDTHQRLVHDMLEEGVIDIA